jgi:hypothetical protein
MLGGFVVDPMILGQLSDPRKRPAYGMYSCLLVWKRRGLDALHHRYQYKKYFSIWKRSQVKLARERKINLRAYDGGRSEGVELRLFFMRRFSLAAGWDSFNAPESSVLFLLRFSGEAEEERNLFVRSQRHALTPKFYQMNPHSFQILRIHCHELKFLASQQ